MNIVVIKRQTGAWELRQLMHWFVLCSFHCFMSAIVD